MDSTSTAGDSVSEELQSDATATSLNTATPITQAVDINAQSVQHERSKEDGQTQDSTKLEAALDPLKAAGAGAQAGTEEVGQSSTDEIEDDVSVNENELEEQKEYLNYTNQETHTQSSNTKQYVNTEYKRQGTKYAQVAAIYTQGLEHRVGMVERDLLELQYKLGSKERPKEARQVTWSILHP